MLSWRMFGAPYFLRTLMADVRDSKKGMILASFLIVPFSFFHSLLCPFQLQSEWSKLVYLP